MNRTQRIVNIIIVVWPVSVTSICALKEIIEEAMGFTQNAMQIVINNSQIYP